MQITSPFLEPVPPGTKWGHPPPLQMELGGFRAAFAVRPGPVSPAFVVLMTGCALFAAGAPSATGGPPDKEGWRLAREPQCGAAVQVQAGLPAEMF